jgi:chorismate dehydratase
MIVGEPRPTPQPLSARRTLPVRLGVIDYLNVRPVYEWILRQADTDGGLPSIATVSGVPAQMNAALQSGLVDISNVSSYAYGANCREWLLMPRLSVAAHGRVDSVLLFTWHREWRALDGASIALSDQSATSSALVRALCTHRYRIHPRFAVVHSDLDAMLAAHDAALLIGDRALVERHAQRNIAGRGRPHVIDLAAEWAAWTGLPFVFAVWAGRADRASALEESGVLDLLPASKAWGLAHLDQIAAARAPQLGLSQQRCAAYLHLLDYDLSPQDLTGLRTFLEMTIPDFSWARVQLLGR